MTPKRFMLIAGEASGDMLAAELVRELRARIDRRNTYTSNAQPLYADLAPRFFGAGGPCMAAAGVELAFDMTQHSVIGLSDVLKNYFKFKRLFNQLFTLATQREPHAIICVDFSGFNRRFAAAIKKHVRARRGTFNNWEPKIIQYISPQVWASREERAYQIARDFDLLLSIFPFEKDWYAARVPKLRVEFVGHPMIDRYAIADCGLRIAESGALENPVVVLLPGSRKSELERHFPVMLEAFDKISRALSSPRAIAVLPNETLTTLAQNILKSAIHNPQSAIKIQVGKLSQALAQATIAIASTGTVTMECACFGVPTVTLYRTSWSTYQIAKRIVKVKSLTMPNLLANEEVFPEFIQDAATPENISRAALELLCDQQRREKIKTRLAAIVATLGGPGASQRAADAILKIVP
jgi:lipid-A-disaccharide synthase